MESSNTCSNGNANGDALRLEDVPVVRNAWTDNIHRMMAAVDGVFDSSTESAIKNGDITNETDPANSGEASGACPPLTEASIREINATQDNRLVAHQESREQSKSSGSVIAQRGSPPRQIADTAEAEAEAAGTNGRQTLQELTLTTAPMPEASFTE